MTSAAFLLTVVLLLQTAAQDPSVTAEQDQPTREGLLEQAQTGQAPSLADAPRLKGSELRISRPEVGIDEPAELIATIRIEKGYHIQDRDPGIETLIASRLIVETIAGIDFAEEEKQIWSDPHIRDIPVIGKVRQHSGEVSIRVPFRITDSEFPSGPVTVQVLFRYQACNDEGLCDWPRTAAASVSFVADTPNPPAATQDAHVAEPTESADRPPRSAEPNEPAGEFVVPRLTEQDWTEDIPWQPWRPGLAEELSRRGHLVYVDYTATWCLTCLTNKKLVLETDRVRAKMRALGVIPIKADFTKPDPIMQAEIEKWANTVPVNLIYAPGKPDRPVLLPAVLTPNTVIRALENPESFASGSTGQRGLLLMILAGFLGGLILNVMPCVLPVISIKILSFVQQAGEDPRRVFRLGLAFCAGIMVWFWAFAALSSVGEIPWQYPQVVIALGSILFVFALSLFGVFEIVLPGAAAGRLDALTAREGYGGAFLKGLLATLLGTACTAPFLAGAMAYALTQPAATVFIVFSAAGLGMASPYLLLSARPGWLRFIPRPGPWMVTFKQAAGFVLLGTVVWLLWILAAQLDGEGVVWTVAFWGFLALAAWMLGTIKLTWRPGRRATVWAASVAVAALGFYFCYFWMYDWAAR